MASKSELNRKRIIDTADDLFYRQGYERTSFTDIADAANIARGNFYYYYKSKDEILSAVLEKRAADIRQMLARWDEEISDPKQRIRRYIKILSKSQDEIQHYGCPMGSLCTELAKIRHSMLENANDLFDIFLDWLIVQLTALGRTDARMQAMRLTARLQGISLVTNAYQDTEFLQQEVKELMLWLDQL